MSSQAIPLNIGIDDTSRAKIAEGLSRLLVDTYSVYRLKKSHPCGWLNLWSQIRLLIKD